jgi:hypothetical protein
MLAAARIIPKPLLISKYFHVSIGVLLAVYRFCSAFDVV